MGSSQSLNSGDYKQQLGYYPSFDNRPIAEQDYKIVEQKHLSAILSGAFSDILEDENVEHVWIYYCPLKNTEGVKMGASVLGSVAGVAVGLSFVPAIKLVALPVAAVAGIGAALLGGTVECLNHQFVMIETEKWLYLVAKDNCGCKCLRATPNLKNQLLDTQKQYNQATGFLQSDPNPQIWKEDRGKGRLFDMIQWMKNEEVIENVYNWAGENCKGLAQALFNLFARDERC